MKIRPTLLAFFLGVLATSLFSFANTWGINKRWEFEAYNHGYGYFTFRMPNTNKLTFHWFAEPSAATPVKKSNWIKI